MTSTKFTANWKQAKLIPVERKYTPTAPRDYTQTYKYSLFTLKSAGKNDPELQISTYLSLFIILFILNNLDFVVNKAPYPHSFKLLMISKEGTDNGKINVLALLNFSKDFNSVRHDSLLDKLRIYFNFQTSY